MRKFFVLVLSVFVLSLPVMAQDFFHQNTRVGNLDVSRAVVGTTTAVAIAPASIGGNLMSWKICNDAVNTSTHLYVGKATDAADDGVMLDKGQCVQCLNCKPDTLRLMRVKGQAADNGYTVLQYRQ
jgi:hypothetical protein